MEKKSFKVGDVVRYADGWCNKGEESARLVVVEAFDDVQKARIVNPAVAYAFGAHRNEWVTYDMIESADRRRDQPEVFYTGGGIWLSAMWIDENRYAVTDNDCAMGGFCIYDHREEDQDDEFPCQNMVGEKYLNETEEPYKMTDEERYIYFRLHDALLREADSIDLNGKWCADIIHTDGADTFPQFAYRGTFYFESGAEATAYGVDWPSFCTDVRLKTGIRLPLRKNMQFFKLSDFEQIAGIDAAHERPNGFHVTKRERFGEGWRAHEAICR